MFSFATLLRLTDSPNHQTPTGCPAIRFSFETAWHYCRLCRLKLHPTKLPPCETPVESPRFVLTADLKVRSSHNILHIVRTLLEHPSELRKCFLLKLTAFSGLPGGMHRTPCREKDMEHPSPLWKCHLPAILMCSPTQQLGTLMCRGLYGGFTMQPLD